MELADYATNSVIRYNLEGTIQYCNAATETHYGWKTAAMPGRHFRDLMLEHSEGSILWANLFRIGHWDGPVRRRSHSGDEIIANIRLVVRHDSLGNPFDVVEYSASSINLQVNSIASPPLNAALGAPLPAGSSISNVPDPCWVPRCRGGQRCQRSRMAPRSIGHTAYCCSDYRRQRRGDTLVRPADRSGKGGRSTRCQPLARAEPRRARGFAYRHSCERRYRARNSRNTSGRPVATCGPDGLESC